MTKQISSGVKIIKPITPGQRGRKDVDYSVLTKKKPEKKLLKVLANRAGRSKTGRITVRHRGGGHKKKYRLIDFKREKFNIPARVVSLEYDPYRNCFIALVVYMDGEKRYILAPEGLKLGSQVESGENASLDIGNCLPLKKILVGSSVHNIELNPGQGGKLIRSAGVGAQILAQEERYTNLKLSSGEIRKIRNDCLATIGQLSNPEHSMAVLGKAGRKRHLGIRPTVRGSAMSVHDHPHGGGEGRAPIGLRKGPKTPWGKQAFGVKTRKRKKPSNKFILKKRK